MMQGTATIESIAHGGHGICNFQDKICFVPGALPGDRAAIRVDRVQRGIQWATMLAVVEPSPHRGDVDVQLHGGNSWLPFTYPAQAEWKVRILADCLQRIAKTETDIEFIEDATLRTGYRTRATVHCDGESVGFYARGTHDIVDGATCPLLHPHLARAISTLAQTPPRSSVDITVNPEGDEALVWTKKREGRAASFAMYNFLRDGEPRHQFFFDGVPIVNGCFSQASLLLNRLLQGRVHKCLSGATSILDLYCGSGNLSLTLPAAVEVYGVDHAHAAVEAAADRREFYRTGDEEVMAEALSARTYDIAILDPPRQGAKKLITLINESKLDRLVYVACEPAAFARDTKSLTDTGWQLGGCTVLDLYPNTPHLETVAVFSR